MCCFSMCGQILYGGLLLGCIAMTSVALFTNSWTNVKDNLSDLDGKTEGIMPWNCIEHSTSDSCHNWWNNQKGWEKAVVVMMCLALIFELIALAWNLVTFFACCCKKYVVHPLGPLAFIFSVLLLASVIVYGVNNKEAIKVANNLKPDLSLGWSFWMAVGATVLGFITTVVGSVTVCLAESDM